MSIITKDLTKTFGTQTAVDALSFEAKEGEIVGFLGPNGAGKSTTMKMLTGFMVPDSGSVAVCGYDPVAEPIKVKQCVGYLPEHNPLYSDLYVREYLSVVAQIHGLSDIQDRIAGIIDMTGLGRENHKRIGALSKGYKQRVGLAQALIHDPRVLILDEPTSGLDPNQLIEIRALIKKLGKTKTIIFSTHILQEVQAVCDRVIIINQGRMVLDRPITYLDDMMTGSQIVVVEFDRRILMNSLKSEINASGVEEISERVYRVSTNDEVDLRPAIFRYAVEKGAVILEMQRHKGSVEDIFQMTTRAGS